MIKNNYLDIAENDLQYLEAVLKDRKSCDDGNHIYNNFQNISIFAIRYYAIKSSVSDSLEDRRKRTEGNQ